MKNKLDISQINEIVSLYIQGLNSVEISKKFNCSSLTIRNYLKKSNVKIRDKFECNKSYNFNYSFLNSIDTPEKAWLLGLFYSGGYNDTKRNMARIKIHLKDYECLKTVKKILNFNGPIHIRDNYCEIVLFSKEFSNDLLKHGCYPAKSLTVSILEHIKNSLYLNSFLLGVVDGDGHLRIRKRKNKTEFIFEIASGSKKMLHDLSRIFKQSHIDYGSKKICIRGGKKQVLKYLKWIYSNDISSMNRKKLIYENMLNYY